MRSSLEIFDMNQKTTRVLWQSDALFEAPNWHPDGRRILVNCDGRLYWVHLDGSGPHPIDTNGANKCNNDHGISPDGRWIVLSDKTETGLSCIYIMPVEGGTPRRITPNVPSYWHGWSPDGQTMTYCARRNGIFHIAKCAVDGGAETILTTPDCHHDGPDFTHDGKWIWFNSDRTGTSELWRMTPKGEALQQMTDDDRVNWFPHPSPDGLNILYLAYPYGTLQHPRDLNVELRRIAPDGTGKETLVTLFGGQGTINTPCWAPDGHALAFMRYQQG